MQCQCRRRQRKRLDSSLQCVFLSTILIIVITCIGSASAASNDKAAANGDDAANGTAPISLLLSSLRLLDDALRHPAFNLSGRRAKESKRGESYTFSLVDVAAEGHTQRQLARFILHIREEDKTFFRRLAPAYGINATFDDELVPLLNASIAQLRQLQSDVNGSIGK